MLDPVRLPLQHDLAVVKQPDLRRQRELRAETTIAPESSNRNPVLSHSQSCATNARPAISASRMLSSVSDCRQDVRAHVPEADLVRIEVEPLVSLIVVRVVGRDPGQPMGLRVPVPLGKDLRPVVGLRGEISSG